MSHQRHFFSLRDSVDTAVGFVNYPKTCSESSGSAIRKLQIQLDGIDGTSLLDYQRVGFTIYTTCYKLRRICKRFVLKPRRPGMVFCQISNAPNGNNTDKPVWRHPNRHIKHQMTFIMRYSFHPMPGGIDSMDTPGPVCFINKIRHLKEKSRPEIGLYSTGGPGRDESITALHCLDRRPPYGPKMGVGDDLPHPRNRRLNRYCRFKSLHHAPFRQ